MIRFESGADRKVNFLLYIETSATRTREAGEIIPVSAEKSATKDNDDVNYGAGLAIDMNMETRSIAVEGSDDKVWIKINLDQVYCIEQVGRYVKNASSSTTNKWTCKEDQCIDCENEYCKPLTVTVSIERSNTSYHPFVSDCKYGDTVKLESTHSSLYVNEIWIIGKQGKKKLQSFTKTLNNDYLGMHILNLVANY